MPSLDIAQPELTTFLRGVGAVSDCEPEADQLRQELLLAVQSVSRADGVALFEIDRGDIVCRAAVGRCASLQDLRLRRATTVIATVSAAVAPIEIEAATASGRDAELLGDLGLATMLLAPLRRGQRSSGTVLVGYRDPATRSAVRDELLQLVAQVGAARLEHLALASERESKDRLFAVVAEAGRAVLASDTPAQTLCDWARKLADAPYASFVQPKSANELVLTAQSGATLPALTLRLDEPSLAGTAFLSGRAQVVPNYQRHPAVLARVVEIIADAGLAEPRGAAYIPVHTGREPLGVVCLLLDEPLTMQTMTVLGLLGHLAGEAALAIDRDRLRRELERQASTDALTAVANRRTYVTRLSLELARANRAGRPVSLVLIDLDHFKSYNDRHGHQAGDALLRMVSGRWLAQMREVDLLSRLGGDEFAVVLPDTSASDAFVFTQRLLAVVADEVTASAGIAQWDGAEDQLTFYRRCDEALYDAKNAGRNGVRVAR